jgi:hypothetical protein
MLDDRRRSRPQIVQRNFVPFRKKSAVFRHKTRFFCSDETTGIRNYEK